MSTEIKRITRPDPIDPDIIHVYAVPEGETKGELKGFVTKMPDGTFKASQIIKPFH